MTLDMRFSASNYARHFLEERLQELKVKLEASEKQLIEYAQKEGIVDVDNKQPQVMTEFQGVQNAYSQAVTTRLLLAEAWNQAQADGGNSLPQVMSDSIIQSCARQVVAIARELSGSADGSKARLPRDDRVEKPNQRG